MIVCALILLFLAVQLPTVSLDILLFLMAFLIYPYNGDKELVDLLSIIRCIWSKFR